MKGKLFVIDGVDGSGKATQTLRLYETLLSQGRSVGKVEFPNYASPSSSLIKMYLNGDFGESAQDINPYVASTFYAVDRFATFRQNWQPFYDQGGILLADRYTTSNMIHQGGKIADPVAKETYLQWLIDFEYRLFELPTPDCVIFLDMPPKCSHALRESRNCLKQDLHNDIHESDDEHIIAAYNNALAIARDYGWLVISCVDALGAIRTIDAIHQDILSHIMPFLPSDT